jgi:phosphatidate cytidylyltransferase
LATAALLGTAFTLRGPGLKAFASIMVIIGAFELRKIFLSEESRSQRVLFLAVTLMPLTWIVEVFYPALPSEKLLLFEIALLSLFYLSSGVLMGRELAPLSTIFSFDSKSILGLIYIGVLPWFTIHITDFQHGELWMIALLLIVFFGDTFAYFFGKLWGQTKVLPTISPKKTIMGAIGGLIGSTVAAAASSLFLPEMPLWAWLLCGPIVGFIAQIGDFSESLFKRVAHVKDSGSIMPGHGGVLDRIDGVLFAGPVFYVLISINFLA